MLKKRIKALEQETIAREAVLIVVGRPTTEQARKIEQSRYGALIQIPDNRRDRHAAD